MKLLQKKPDIKKMMFYKNTKATAVSDFLPADSSIPVGSYVSPTVKTSNILVLKIFVVVRKSICAHT
jgi:hypothetical protein